MSNVLNLLISPQVDPQIRKPENPQTRKPENPRTRKPASHENPQPRRWIRKSEADELADSVAKLHAILHLCAALGVLTAPALLGADCGGAASAPVWVVPLLSWRV